MKYGRLSPCLDRILIVASGPSAANLVIPDSLPVIAVNGAIDGLARADYWFTLDPSPANRKRMDNPKPGTSYLVASSPQMVSQAKGAHLTFLHRTPGRGISTKPDSVMSGNSAFGALQVAVLLGAKRIGLVGVDATQDGYWHGPGQSRSLVNLPAMFSCAMPQLLRANIEVRLGTTYDRPRVTCFAPVHPTDLMEWLMR